MNKREKEVSASIKEAGLTMVGGFTSNGSRYCFTAEAPNGKQTKFRAPIRTGDKTSDLNFYSDLKRFAHNNPATALAVALTKVDEKAKQKDLVPLKVNPKLLKEVKKIEETTPSTKVTGISVKASAKLPELKPLASDIKVMTMTQATIKNLPDKFKYSDGFPSTEPSPTLLSVLTYPDPDKAIKEQSSKPSEISDPFADFPKSTPAPTVTKRITRTLAHRPLITLPTTAAKPPAAPLPKTPSTPNPTPAKAESSTPVKETLPMTNNANTLTTKTTPVKRTTRALSMVEFYSLCEWTRKQDVASVTSHIDFALDATKALGIDISPSTIPSVLEATGIVFPKMFRGLVPVTAQSQRDLAIAVVGIMKELGITPQPAVLKIAGLE